MTCKQCGKDFPSWIMCGTKRKTLTGRSYCLECSPIGNKKQIVRWMTIDGVECRKCSTCNVFKQATTEFFHARKEGGTPIKSTCKVCDQLLDRQRSIDQKTAAVNYKGGRCVDCDGVFPICAYDFHHLDPSTKDFEIGKRHMDLDRLKPELDKCVLLCANCHRIRHAQSNL